MNSTGRGAGGFTPLRPGDDLFHRLPYNIEAEQCLLGALFLDNNAYYKVSEFLRPEHFGNAVNARIFAAIGKVLDTGYSANPVSLKQYFDAEDALAEIGGGQYLAQCAAAVPTLLNTENYARIVLDLYQRRELIALGEDLAYRARQVSIDEEAPKLIGDAEAKLAAISDSQDLRRMRSIGSFADESVEKTELAFKKGATFVPTGFIAIDAIIGGLLPGDIEILAGRPAMGKTALALQMGYQIARTGRPGVFFSLEQTGDQLMQRLLAHRTGISPVRQMRGDVDMVDMQQLIASAAAIKEVPFYIDDNGGLSISQICFRMRRAKQRQKIAFGIIDHLQLIQISNRRDSQRHLELSEITKSLKVLAKDLDIPIILLSQLNRGVEGRDDKRPTLSDLRESGAIEEDADRVMFIYREEYYADRVTITRREGEDDEKLAARQRAHNDRLDACRGRGDVFVAKNRHGAANKLAFLAWDGELMRFSDLTDVVSV